MRVTTCQHIDTYVDVEIDVDIDVVLGEFWRRVESIADEPKRFRVLGPVLDQCTKILAAVKHETIAAMPEEARQEMAKRLGDEFNRYDK